MKSRFKVFLVLVSVISFPVKYVFADNLHVFTGSNAGTVVADALVKAGAGAGIKLNITGVRSEDELASAEGDIRAEVNDLNLDKEHERWKAILLFSAPGRNLPPVTLSGGYEALAIVPVLKRQVREGEVINANDIDYSKEAARHIRKNIITDVKELIGKSPKRIISQGRPIRQDEIANPAILQKGAHVTMIYKSNNLEIKTLGEAMDSGAKGDVIRVKNLASKSIISGVVESSDSVRVSSPENSSAEAM